MPALRLDKLGKHSFGIDGQESATAAGQHFTFLIQNLRAVDVPPSLDTNLSRLHLQRLVQRYWLQIIHRNLCGQRDYLAQLIYFAHCLIEHRGDDPAVAMSRRPGKLFPQAKTAYKAILLAIVDKFQTHAVSIVSAASKAIILLQLDVTGIVTLSVRLLRHSQNSIPRPGCIGV